MSTNNTTMHVYSGKCEHGKCGLPTSLVDNAGNQLRVGDIVASFTIDEFGVNNFYDMSVIVEDRPKLVGLTEDRGPFVMGLRSVDWSSEERWHMRRLKKWEDVIDGEHWSAYGFNYRKGATND